MRLPILIHSTDFAMLGLERRFELTAREHRHQKGASLVEYAFVLGGLLTLILGISGFGHALFVYHHLNNAAKEATRYAAVRGATCNLDADGGSCQASNSASGISGQTTIADVKAFVASITPASVDSSQFTYTICGVKDSAICSSSPAMCKGSVNGVAQFAKGYPGCMVSVQVAYPYSFIFPFLPTTTVKTAPCTKAGLCLSSESEMVIVH